MEIETEPPALVAIPPAATPEVPKPEAPETPRGRADDAAWVLGKPTDKDKERMVVLITPSLGRRSS